MDRTARLSGESDRTLDHCLVSLFRAGLSGDENAILQEGAEQAQRVTHSSIAYAHFMNDDQMTIELGTWSRNTLRFCTAVYDRHYDLDKAGIWGDAARNQAPVLHNDYASQPARSGYPKGHAHLLRHLGVPVLQDGKVTLLVGVGNKDADYTDDDIRRVQAVADTTWELIESSRKQERDRLTAHFSRTAQDLLSFIEWSWDAGEDRLSWRGDFSHLIPGVQAPGDLSELLAIVDAHSADELADLFLQHDDTNGRFDLKIHVVDAHGEPRYLRLLAESVMRTRGETRLFRGILQDLTVLDELEQARKEASTDPLTGLLNRKGLHEAISPIFSGDRRRQAGCAALMIVDLDRFKQINDRFGHEVGDEVLVTIGHRLARRMRRSDHCARIGGDEFAVVAAPIPSRSDAEAIAASIARELSRPILHRSRSLEISGSVGVAVVDLRSKVPDWITLYRAADRAMYAAKARNDHVVLEYLDEADVRRNGRRNHNRRSSSRNGD